MQYNGWPSEESQISGWTRDRKHVTAAASATSPAVRYIWIYVGVFDQAQRPRKGDHESIRSLRKKGDRLCLRGYLDCRLESRDSCRHLQCTQEFQVLTSVLQASAL